MKNRFWGAVGLASSLVMSATAFAQETVSVSGSTSVTEVMEVLAETYEAKNPSVFVEVQGTGSSAGVRAAIDGTSELGMSSRDLKSSEKKVGLVETVIARDGIAVVIHNSNSVKSLTPAQIKDIYTGKITNWSQVGGEAKPIVAVTRDAASGTRGAFEDIMGLKKKVNGRKVSAISPKVQVANGNGAVKTTVANNPNAVGYISLGSVDASLAAVAVDGAAATVANVKNGSYKVARPFLVLNQPGKPSAAAQAFLTFIQSDEGQAVVEKHGYISIK